MPSVYKKRSSAAVIMPQELVGRPLVPFFDQDDNVNTSLNLFRDAFQYEDIQIDARVWNKEVGYFEYPPFNSDTADQNACSRQLHISQKSVRNQIKSAPIAIFAKMNQKNVEVNACSWSSKTESLHSVSSFVSSSSSPTQRKMLLTPQMIRSTSPLPAGKRMMASEPIQFHRNVYKAKAKAESDSDSDLHISPKSEDDKKQNVVKESKAVPKKIKGSQTGKAQKKDLSAGGKWAWSAFQNSPEPNTLPLPPYVSSKECSIAVKPKRQFSSPGIERVLKEPISPSNLQPPVPPPPLETETTLSKSYPLSKSSADSNIERSMTQDLRRLLNIGH